MYYPPAKLDDNKLDKQTNKQTNKQTDRQTDRYNKNQVKRDKKLSYCLETGRQQCISL